MSILKFLKSLKIIIDRLGLHLTLLQESNTELYFYKILSPLHPQFSNFLTISLTLSKLIFILNGHLFFGMLACRDKCFVISIRSLWLVIMNYLHLKNKGPQLHISSKHDIWCYKMSIEQICKQNTWCAEWMLLPCRYRVSKIFLTASSSYLLLMCFMK